MKRNGEDKRHEEYSETTADTGNEAQEKTAGDDAKIADALYYFGCLYGFSGNRNWHADRKTGEETEY